MAGRGEDAPLAANREKLIPLPPLSSHGPSIPQSSNSDMDVKALLIACIIGFVASGYTIVFHQRGDINTINCAAVAFGSGVACAVVAALCRRVTPQTNAKLALLSLAGSVVLAAVGVALLSVAVTRIDPQSLPRTKRPVGLR